MPQSLIRPLRFELLTNFEMLECSTLIVENALAPARAQSVGTGSGNDDYGYSDPGVPDTGPATPPDDDYNGGTYIDPNA